MRSLFANQPQILICGEAANGKEAVEQTVKLKPHIVILDVTMPLMNGLDAAREIKRLTPAPKVVILTMHESKHMRTDAQAAGADAYVPKMEAAEKLLDMVKFLLEIRTETV